MDKIRLAVLGTGGLGRNVAKIAEQKTELSLVAICDKDGYAFSLDGLKSEQIEQVKTKGDSVGKIPRIGSCCSDPLGEMIKKGADIDGIFVALPNLPNNFVPNVVKRFVTEGYRGVWSDALKRTPAMAMMFELDPLLREYGNSYITGAGATPGMLTAAAVIAAQSFAKIETVDIHWGVGIASWDEYKATIREDIAHLDGYDVDKAMNLSDKEVEKLLDERDGKLELKNMEHADELLLKNAMVIDDFKQVTVGGIMDTRNAKKPVSTTMTLTGITFEGKRSSHKFILGDETSMAANVIGPALGYLKKALWLRNRGIFGVFGSTDFMPMVVK